MDGKGPGPGPFYFWLILTVWPARDVVDGRSHPAWAALGALLLYAGLYTGVVWSSFSARTSLRAVGWWLAALTVVTAVSAYEFGGRWFALFPGRGRPPRDPRGRAGDDGRDRRDLEPRRAGRLDRRSERENPLTDRERDVLTAAADGSMVADISGRLHLSESTVRNYLSAAIQKRIWLT